MKQLSELLTSTIVSGDIVTILNSNLRRVKKEDFDSALRKLDGSESGLRLVASLGSWHKVLFARSGDTCWFRVRTYRLWPVQLELKIGLWQE